MIVGEHQVDRLRSQELTRLRAVSVQNTSISQRVSSSRMASRMFGSSSMHNTRRPRSPETLATVAGVITCCCWTAAAARHADTEGTAVSGHRPQSEFAFAKCARCGRISTIPTPGHAHPREIADRGDGTLRRSSSWLSAAMPGPVSITWNSTSLSPARRRQPTTTRPCRV